MPAIDLHPEKQLYMKKNIGDTDRGLRILTSIILVGIILLDVIPGGVLAIIAWVVAATLLLTSFVSFCPIYALLGVNSSDREQA